VDNWRNTVKEGFPTRSYNCAVGANREFHYIHNSHPGAHNDKTISRFDQYMCKIRSGELYGQYNFHLRSSQTEWEEQKGLYAITDGGYHAWRSLQYPIKSSAVIANMRWSKRLESVRKLSECAFGVLKHQFRILNIGFPFREPSEKTLKCDNTFRVCAMLYNQMLRSRQLHTIGEAQEDWESAGTDLDDERIRTQRLCFSEEYHGPQAHWVNDEAVGNETVQEVEEDHHALTADLIEHYRLEFEEKRILWPKSALQLRGRVDCRPKEAGRCEEGEERHAFISDIDSDSESD
jgi:hypothetical protein